MFAQILNYENDMSCDAGRNGTFDSRENKPKINHGAFSLPFWQHFNIQRRKILRENKLNLCDEFLDPLSLWSNYSWCVS